MKRKLCYSAYTYYFNLPANTRSIWLGRKFSLYIYNDPLLFTFQENESGEVTCFKIGRYEALRVPKKVVLEHAEELQINNPKNDVFFKLDYSIGLWNIAVFTKIDPDIEEKEITLSRMAKPRSPRKKVSDLPKHIFIIVPQLNSEEYLHITRAFPNGVKSTCETRSLCRTPVSSEYTIFPITDWGAKDFHYCSTCRRLYEKEITNA